MFERFLAFDNMDLKKLYQPCLTPKCTPLVFFAKFEKSLKVLSFHFVVDFLENSYQDQPCNAKHGNVIFTCTSYVNQKI